MRRIILLLLIGIQGYAWANEIATLKYSPQFILEKVAGRMQLDLDAAKVFPAIHMESQTTLDEFKKAIFPQWGEVDVFTNAYIISNSDIYLIDDASYYKRLHRYIDDSLAHEFTHYLQHIYKGWDLMNNPTLEDHAIGLQTWFRETYMEKPQVRPYDRQSKNLSADRCQLGGRTNFPEK